MLVNDQKRGCAYERNKKHVDEKGSHCTANKSRGGWIRYIMSPSGFLPFNSPL
jgi:hypothetical protein